MTATDHQLWDRKYNELIRPALNPVFTGFNVNLDRTVPVTRGLLGSAAFSAGDLGSLRARLIHSMKRCTAEEWFVQDPDLYRHIANFFTDRGSLSLGGQAGIAALHLAKLGVPDVTCLSPAMGPEAAQQLRNSRVRIPGRVAGSDVVHHILEYAPGLVPPAAGAIPRNNRFIASPQKTKESVLLPEDTLRDILPGLAGCTRAFLSGYQYLAGNSEFRAAADQIAMLRKADHAMRVHIECVSVDDPTVNAGIVHNILPAADSAGMNEHELSLLLGHETGREPEDLSEGMLELADITGLCRIHLHTFGYYLLLIRTRDTAVMRSRDALLFASRIVAGTAGGGAVSITADGIRAARKIGRVYGTGTEPGIVPAGDYHLVVVPTLIREDIRKTVGLGDILSSTAFVADPMD